MTNEHRQKIIHAKSIAIQASNFMNEFKLENDKVVNLIE